MLETSSNTIINRRVKSWRVLIKGINTFCRFPVNKCWMLCLLLGGWTALCYNTGNKQQVTALTLLQSAEPSTRDTVALYSLAYCPHTHTYHHQSSFHAQVSHTVFSVSAHLSFPVLLLGFLRKDWFGPERVDMERGEARENVEGGVLGIFFPRCPIHFFCSSVVRASRSMSRAEVTS